MQPSSTSTPISGVSRSQVAVTQPTKPTKAPIDRSRSLPAMTNICAMVASAIGIARFSIRVKPKQLSARGVREAIASSTKASDSAGSTARNSRGALSLPKARDAGWLEVAVTSTRLRERGLNDLFLGEFVAPQISDDGAVAEDIHVIALLQFVGLGRVPQKSSPGAGFLGDEIIDFELGGDIDAAHRIVHQHEARVGAERAGKQHLLLIAAGKGEDVMVDIGGADLDLVAPEIGQRLLALARNQQASAQPADRAYRHIFRDRPLRKNAAGLGG